MRNLLRISLDKLDSLPSHQKSWQTLSSKYEIVEDYSRFRLRNRAENTMFHRIRRMLEASVGKDWNEVHSKIRAITKHLSYEFDAEYAMDIVVQPFWSATNQRWEFKEHRWGRNQDLAEHIQLLKVMWSNHPRKFYYVCPKSNIIRLVKSYVWKKEHNSEFYRKHYKMLIERRKKHKELRLPPNPNLLKIINDPDLFKFYCRLVKDYRELLKKIDSHERYLFRKKTGEKTSWWDWEPKPTSQDCLNLDSYKRQIEEIEKGNFNIFFESAVYLYSQQKECHHFATP